MPLTIVMLRYAGAMDTSNEQTASADEVLAFWLGDRDQDAAARKQQMARWFAKDPAFDRHIEDRFGATLNAARAAELDAWATTPRGWLALLIVLDQFSRNIHRGTPQAFAADPQARALALAGIERGDDQRIEPVSRMFCYLPLEHAEDRQLQERSVALFAALHEGAADADKALLATTLDYARKHAAVVERFGRFPHRNHILGRTNSRDEAEYLAQPGAGF